MCSYSSKLYSLLNSYLPELYHTCSPLPKRLRCNSTTDAFAGTPLTLV